MYDYSKEINFFKEHGYLNVNSLVDIALSAKFKQAFFSIFKSYSNLELQQSYDNKGFVDKIKAFRKSNQTKLNGLFRSVTKMQSFKNLFCNDQVLALIAQVFNVDASTLIVSEYQFRVDEPHDKLYTLDWHQDGAYYDQDRDGKSGIVINVCIQDCNKNMGTPHLIKGSHKKGELSLTKYAKQESNSLQYNTDAKHISEHNIITLEPKIGDVVLYDMNLIHRSGFNTSTKARFSAIARAFNPLSKNFVPYYFTGKKLLKF